MSDHYFEEEEFTTQFNGRTVLRILAQTRPHWKWVAGFLIAIAFTAFLDSYMTFLSKRIIDEGILAGDRQTLARIVTTYAGLILAQAVFVFSFIYLTGVLGERVRYDLRKRLFDHLQNLSLSYYSRTPVGWIMSRVTSDTDRVAELVTWGMLDVSWGVINIASSAFFMFLINWKLALIVLAILPILVLVAIQFQKRILVEFRKVRKTNSKITGAYNENISGVRVVKALGREEENLAEFSTLTGEMYRSGYRAAWLSALFLPAVQIISALAVGGIAWYGGLQAQVGALTIGGIYSFLSYITFMIWPIQEMARVFAEMQQSVASAERMFSLMDAVPDIVDRPGAVDAGTVRGDIEFEHVDFYYEDEDSPVLEDFNLYVKQGETIALVGATGGGKSTIVNLLCRFYEPKRGIIRLAGRDYTRYSLHAIQSRVGVVLQTPHLFSGTIRENIRYGCLEATDEEVQEAARLAGAHDFIMTLEKGYDEEVGEALIQKGMEALMRGRTSFVIAHRLSTIKRADRILVIEGGRIAEMGSHAELMRMRGHYYRLYTRQFRHERGQAYDLYRLTGAAPA
jgi:ATP-binding cassette subfamily B protein